MDQLMVKDQNMKEKKLSEFIQDKIIVFGP